ncbi:unnamed protein product [Gadus morhua 'NCC']
MAQGPMPRAPGSSQQSLNPRAGAWNHCSGLCGAWQEGALGKDILLIPFHLTCSQVGIANRKFATQPGTPHTIHHSVQAGDT